MAEEPTKKASVPLWLLEKYNNFNVDGDDAFFEENLQAMLASLLKTYPSILSPSFKWEWRSVEIDYHIHEFIVSRGYLAAGGPWSVPIRRRLRFDGTWQPRGRIVPSPAVRKEGNK